MKKKLNYNYCSDFDNITNLEKLKEQVYINSLCITATIKEAAFEAGVGKRTICTFLSENNIVNKDLILMRINFQKLNKKIKLRNK